MPRNSCIYAIAGPITFRLSSFGILTNYVTKETKGTNLQNIEKDMRAMYLADEGKKLVQRDQSGAEALIVAYLCRHGLFRDLFLNNIKPHVFVALHLFADVWQHKLNEYAGDIRCDIKEFIDCPIAKLREHPQWKQLDRLIKSSDFWPAQERYYYIAKQVCHSHNYAIRPDAFRINVLEKSRGKIVLSKYDAEKYGAFYFSLFPEIPEWHQEVREQIEATRTLYNLFGWPRYFTGEFSERFFKEAYSHVPQSTVACITRNAYIQFQEFVEEQSVQWDLLGDTHDSYVSQCPDSETEVKACAKVMKVYIEPELTNFRGEKFQMKSECAVGYNWGPRVEIRDVNGTLIKVKNPDGLQELKDEL